MAPLAGKLRRFGGGWPRSGRVWLVRRTQTRPLLAAGTAVDFDGALGTRREWSEEPGIIGNAHTTNPLHDCPVCRATGRVESRLPARKRVCLECGGRGRVTPIRREQLIKRMKPITPISRAGGL